MRRVLAVVAAVALAATLAGCAGPSSRARPVWDSGFAGLLVGLCADRAVRSLGSSTVSASSYATANQWGFATATAWTGGTPARPGPRTSMAAGATPVDAAAVHAVAACMRRHPLDWSLARITDGGSRAELQGWYRYFLAPCLGVRYPGANPRPGSVFDAIDGVGALVSPYALVSPESADAALALQGRCPPAPPDLAVQAHLVGSS